MKKFKLAIALATVAIPAMTLAHPLGVPYNSRGECEAERAKNDHIHGAADIESGKFDNFGEANRWMHETFRCAFIDDHWFIVRTS